MSANLKIFPNQQFELLVRSYLDNLVEREVVHNFAMAHIDDQYMPEYQRPVEDLHLMFLPASVPDAEAHRERPQMQYLLGLLDILKQDVEKLGSETVRERELGRMASEDPSKHTLRAEHRDRHRRR